VDQQQRSRRGRGQMTTRTKCQQRQRQRSPSVSTDPHYCLTQPRHHHHLLYHLLHLHPLPSSHQLPSAPPPSISPRATTELAKWPACSTCEGRRRGGG
jgi:hypothetical protein